MSSSATPLGMPGRRRWWRRRGPCARMRSWSRPGIPGGRSARSSRTAQAARTSPLPLTPCRVETEAHRVIVRGLSRPPWLDASELRVGLGCMRLSTDEDRDEERSLATIAAAAEAGVTVFDTARAYGDNERLVARALRRCGAEATARIVTKGGMTRAASAWIPDGRAKAILADCEASLTALDGLPIDLYLIHAPDPRTPWRTSVRALARLARRRPGAARRDRERQSPAAGRSARARPDRGDSGGTFALRRPSHPGRVGRALRRARNRAARAFTARRAEACRTCGRGGDARVAARPLTVCRADPRSPTT